MTRHANDGRTANPTKVIADAIRKGSAVLDGDSASELERERLEANDLIANYRATLQSMESQRATLRADNARLREALETIIDKYPHTSHCQSQYATLTADLKRVAKPCNCFLSVARAALAGDGGKR